MSLRKRVTNEYGWSQTWLNVPEEQLNSIHDTYVQLTAPHIKGSHAISPTTDAYKELQDQVDHLTTLIETLYTKLESVGILKSEI